MVVSIDFGAFDGGAPVWRDVSVLTEIIPRQRYQTPEKFIETSLAVYFNGQVLDRESDNGFTVIDDETFELKIAIPSGRIYTLFVSYSEL